MITQSKSANMSVIFGLNILLDLSRMAATKMFGSLLTQLVLEVLSKSTWFGVIRVIQGCEGMGDIPGI